MGFAWIIRRPSLFLIDRRALIFGGKPPSNYAGWRLWCTVFSFVTCCEMFSSLELIQSNIRWTKQAGNGKRIEGKLELELLRAIFWGKLCRGVYYYWNKMFEAITERPNIFHLNLLLSGRFVGGDMCKTIYLILVHWLLWDILQFLLFSVRYWTG